MEQIVLVEMVLGAWNKYIEQLDDFFDNLPDDDFDLEVYPGKNRVRYIIGHLTAVNDGILSLLGAGEPLYPELIDEFLIKSYRAGSSGHSINDLRIYWRNVNRTLTTYFSTMPLSEWFKKNAGISEGDFLREPRCNKLNIVLTKTHHLVYHLGQLTLLNSKIRNMAS
ncbi:DinB family protein [Dyadobacter chenwenxiniae]|uniref:DinB family protein n=1 Tax=Dyadobacter chenwenxiniae TaxID=2906456 RepID=A0A9X1PKE8_9BACT|nr:DinB family protein [Dyadobacter chenwenxiniae]MCF0062543.1 DinB family protein [Dyadobacter chenwenxiniae]UON83713.1 DinB family protein [Dyadobacter chenwenxiniae]